jgi:hypothetical protein
MTATMTMEERRSALDEFAKTTPEDGVTSVPVPVTPTAAPAVVGSQSVAVHRDEQRILQRLAALGAAAGEEWFYRFPVKNKRTGQTDWIEGPSIKLANDLARIYGNCEVETRVQGHGDSYMIYARFIDLETGFALTRAFQQSKSAARIGGSDNARRDDMALQIGQSKAIRNVVTDALQTYADFAFEQARNSLVGKIGGDVEKYRRITADRIKAHIDIKRAEAVVGRTVDRWLASDISMVIAMGKSCEEGMATWDETFPPLKKPGESVEQKVDSFVDERSMVNTRIGADEASTGAPAGSTEQASAEENRPNPTASADAQRSAITTALRLANNGQLEEEEKIEQLEQMEPLLADEDIPAAFIKTVLKTAADVARGSLPIEQARRYLEGMVK